nr:cation:proton antiporter [Bacillota bacterium]
MEHIDYFILDLALITVVASAVTLIFQKIRMPVVLGYIIAGFFISPNFVWLPTVVDIDNIDTWANIGIVFLMFGLGLEFSFRKIATVGVSAFVTALTVIGAMIFIGTLTGHLMGWAKMDCIFLGGMISISSTMIIMKSYDQYSLRKEKFSDLVLGTMVVEDIVAIFMIIILTAISVGRGATGLECLSQIGTLMLFLVVWLVLGVYLIPTFLKKTKHLMNDEVLLIIAIAICFGMVVISLLIGFSEALGAFMAGSILAGTVSGEKIDRLIKPIKDLFGAVFFVSVGMMVEPSLLIKYIVPILIITFFTITGQMIFSTIGILLSGNDLHTAVRGGWSMVQIGEFSFIIAALGKSLGVTSDFLYPIIVCVAMLTIFLTPFFIKNSEK